MKKIYLRKPRELGVVCIIASICILCIAALLINNADASTLKSKQINNYVNDGKIVKTSEIKNYGEAGVDLPVGTIIEFDLDPEGPGIVFYADPYTTAVNYKYIEDPSVVGTDD